MNIDFLKKIRVVLIVIIVLSSLMILSLKSVREMHSNENKPAPEETLKAPVGVEQVVIFRSTDTDVQSHINQWLLKNHDNIEITARTQSLHNHIGITISIFYKRKS